MYSGREIPSQSGVGVFLSMAKVKSLIRYKLVYNIRLLRQVKNTTLIPEYTPTTELIEEEIEEFNDANRARLQGSQDSLVISGDLNAKVGSATHTEEDGIVGNAGLGERNDRGIRIVDFAISNHLAIQSTMFKKQPRGLYT